jgi:hypothetical protein
MKNNLSEPFGKLLGLRQGSTLPCILLNIALEKVVGDSDRETKGTV